MDFSQLHFIRPYLLLLLPLALFIVWYLLRSSNGKDSWSKICDPHLLKHLKVSDGSQGSHWPKLLYPITIIGVIALAGPAYRNIELPLIKSQSALVIALDVSKSMMAEDVKPNRLERAKFKINDILDQRKDGQTALIVYSGDAFVVTPLSDDVETIKLMLKALTPQLMPVQGSREDRALKKAQELIHQANHLGGQVLLITDSVKVHRSQTMVRELAENKIQTNILAVGTEQGAPIPEEYGFLKDKQGKVVTATLNLQEISQLAQAGDGRWSLIRGDSSDINNLKLDVIDSDENENFKTDDEASQKQFIDEGPMLALLLLPLMLLMMRKGLLLSLFFVVSIHQPTTSMALGWEDLWLNDDQKAAKNFKSENYTQVLEESENSAWKAAAAYKQKQYKNASELFSGDDADTFYNQGNALAQMGELQKALDSYDKSLALRPNDEDTLYNRKIVEDALNQQQEQQDQQNQDQNSDSSEDSEKQDGESGEQQEGEQNESEESSSDSQQQDSEQESEEQQSQQQGSPEEQELTEEQKKQLQEELEALEKADQEAQEQEVELSPEELATDAEKKEAMEQWLRRIPDDPGGLLRRKFYHQYNRQNNKPDESEDW